MSTLSISHLCNISALLGTSVEVLSAPQEPYVLHGDGDGDHWLLLHGPEGTPIVRHLGDPASGQRVIDQSVALFLMHDIGSPQHQALVALLDRLLGAFLRG